MDIRNEAGNFSLKNNAGFNVRLEFEYLDDNGNRCHVKGTDSYPLGQTKTADPGNYGVPDGALVWLYASVVAGIDKSAGQLIRYRKGDPRTAEYMISGVTLAPSLGLIGIN